MSQCIFNLLNDMWLIQELRVLRSRTVQVSVESSSSQPVTDQTRELSEQVCDAHACLQHFVNNICSVSKAPKS